MLMRHSHYGPRGYTGHQPKHSETGLAGGIPAVSSQNAYQDTDEALEASCHQQLRLRHCSSEGANTQRSWNVKSLLGDVISSYDYSLAYSWLREP